MRLVARRQSPNLLGFNLPAETALLSASVICILALLAASDTVIPYHNDVTRRLTFVIV